MTSSDQPPVRILSQGAFELAEGPRWVDGRLVFVDLHAGRLLELPATTPGTPRQLADLDVPLGAVAPVQGQPGHWIAAAGTGIALLGPDGALDWLARPEEHAAVPTRMNDGVCDPHGRFWAGSMALDLTPGGGSLYRTDHDGTVHRVLDGLTIVNGPTFNADGDLLYLADTAAAVVYRYGVAADGTLHDRREFARLTHGLPDGMTVDTEGCLWLAVWDGHAVHRYHPDGTLLTTIQVPATRPTSVCLPPGSGQLFITTARRGLTDPAPADGAVLTVPVPATGLPTRGYRPALSR